MNFYDTEIKLRSLARHTQSFMARQMPLSWLMADLYTFLSVRTAIGISPSAQVSLVNDFGECNCMLVEVKAIGEEC